MPKLLKVLELEWSFVLLREIKTQRETKSYLVHFYRSPRAVSARVSQDLLPLNDIGEYIFLNLGRRTFPKMYYCSILTNMVFVRGTLLWPAIFFAKNILSLCTACTAKICQTINNFHIISFYPLLQYHLIIFSKLGGVVWCCMVHWLVLRSVLLHGHVLYEVAQILYFILGGTLNTSKWLKKNMFFFLYRKGGGYMVDIWWCFTVRYCKSER